MNTLYHASLAFAARSKQNIAEGFMIFQRYFVPGIVIMAVMIGGGFATGRELVEFFLSQGPATALAGMVLTAAIIGITSMVSFELARQYQAFDYRTFCRAYMGRYWFLFEIVYLAMLLIVLSVVSSAAGKLVNEITGSPEQLNSILFMLLVAFLVFFGNRFLERIISVWSIIFYIAYGTMFVIVMSRFGGALGPSLASTPIDYGQALWSSLSYTGYNVAVVPIVIFVARNFQSRREAMIAGALAGPLILMPGFALLLAMMAFYPDILSSPIPVSSVLQQLELPALATAIRLVILGALIKTGAGMLHGLNERIGQTMTERGAAMPRWVRPSVALGAMLFAVYAAAAVGIIDLIKHGYRYSSYFFLLVFLLPVLTRGVWLISGGRSRSASGSASEA